jgi:hypothetical protein
VPDNYLQACYNSAYLHDNKGEVEMAGSGKGGKADKGRKQQKKKPQHTLQEKRKLKQEKKNKTTSGLVS